LTEDDIVSFASKWDPLPIHVDAKAAQRSQFGSLTASGAHLLAIKQKLLHDFGFRDSVICSFGLDEIRYKAPGKPGNKFRIVLTWLDQRPSSSIPNAGIARHKAELVNQDEVIVMTVLDTILMKKRIPIA
tara:strand:+ start:2736 stop:3125 length:390 start_codon:yes stop_codon:yes gene_type:complete